MMKFRLVILAIILLLSAFTTFGQDGFIFSSEYYFNGNKYKILVTDEVRRNVPKWSPENDETVPLSQEEAIRISRENLRNIVSSTDEKWIVSEITLKRLLRDNWLYVIEFRCIKNGTDSTIKYKVHIKLDGTIVEPKITPVDNQDK